MTVATVLVLTVDTHVPASVARAVEALGAAVVHIAPVDAPTASLAARVCAAINERDPEPPLIVVAIGPAARLLPAVALSQRSMHRRVGAYLLVDPELPPVTDSWPDAAVTILTDDLLGDASSQGRLRGWMVLTSDEVDRWRPLD